ncbi:MAG: hypothetical protein KIT14_04420 [bacterium]|nr:hypothetical protein [bacterium]
MRRFPVVLLLATLAAACSTPTPKEKGEWKATRPSAEALAAARDECTDEATRETSVSGGSGTLSKAAIGFFLDCMKRKGWALDTVPATTP